MEGKKIAAIGVLIVVIIVGAAITLKKTRQGHQPPAWVMDKLIEKIDVNTLEVVTKPRAEWLGKYAADESGRFKKPKTGACTTVTPRQKPIGVVFSGPAEEPTAPSAAQPTPPDNPSGLRRDPVRLVFSF